MSLITEKVAVPRMSAATDNGKSLLPSNKTSISESEPKINDMSDLDDWNDFQMISSQDYLYTI